MSKINLYNIQKIFGDSLPDKSTFFNTVGHEVTRVMLRYMYKCDSDQRAYLRFKEDFDKFVVANKPVAKKVVKDKKHEVK